MKYCRIAVVSIFLCPVNFSIASGQGTDEPSFNISLNKYKKCTNLLVSCCFTLTDQLYFLAISWREQAIFQWNDDDIHFVLDQNANLDFYIVLALENETTLCEWTCCSIRNIIRFLRQPVFALISWRCRFSREATYTIGLTLPELEPTIHHTQDKEKHANDNTTDAVHYK